ncbi:MAG: hypothetical protein IKV99_01515 [Oscillospiraceae bacterium]|nr:hypothetical protein [Oscillospiraceae bacterium]
MKKAVLSLSPLLLLTVAYANSSWVWISETRPWDVLPWVIVGTLVIEIFAIRLFGGDKRTGRIALFVTLGNLLSFLAPYLIKWAAYTMDGFGFDKYLNHAPSFITGTFYFALTLIVELPLVYCSLVPREKPSRKLMWTVIAANVVTTALVAIIEHTLCQGQW